MANKPIEIRITLDDGTVWIQKNPTFEKMTAPTPTPTPDPTPTPTPTRIEPSKVGVNLNGVQDWDRQLMFADTMKASRGFGTFDQPWSILPATSPSLDGNGWPKVPFGVCVFTDQVNVNGEYNFTCDGEVVAIAPKSMNVSVTNLAFDAATKRSTAKITMNAPKDALATMYLAFNAPTGARNIRIWRPGYSPELAAKTAGFTAGFIKSLAPFGAIRFMDALSTNNSQVSTWASRATLDSPTYHESARGMSYESAIDLCNVANKDGWFNIPALADADHIRSFGALVRSRLKSGLVAYVEFSNEVWNGQFAQYQQNFDAAKSEVEAGDKTLTLDGAEADNPYYSAWRRVAKQLFKIKQLIAPFDDGRFRLILASQLGYTPAGYILQKQIEYLNRYAGGASKVIYGVACAPYFSPGKNGAGADLVDVENVTVDQYVAGLSANANSTTSSFVQAFHKLARDNGVKSIAYEGGVDMDSYTGKRGASAATKAATQTDPRMTNVVANYLNNWFNGGGDQFFYFNLATRFSPDPQTNPVYWGLTDDIRNLTSPKYVGASTVAAARK